MPMQNMVRGSTVVWATPSATAPSNVEEVASAATGPAVTLDVSVQLTGVIIVAIIVMLLVAGAKWPSLS